MTDNYRKDPEAVSRLTPEQYRITQKNGTEPPFRNDYWDNKEPGIYVDVVSGEPLFASVSKFDSHTGWPSFTVPLEPDNVVQRRDFKLLLPRTEVRSAHGGSHLGHLFHDGPREAGGLRYCINSAALRFVSVDDLEREGYGAYRSSSNRRTTLAVHHDDREGNPRRRPPRRVKHHHRTDVNQPVHHEREVDLSGQLPVGLHWIVGTLHIMWCQQVGTQSSEAMGLLVQSILGH